MKMNHLNLTVTDVAAAADFLEKYFGLRRQPGGNKAFTLLFDDDYLAFTLMKASQAEYPRTFHIGFNQENRQRVNEIYQQLKDDGFDVNPPEHTHAWTFYIKAPGGFIVEVASA